MNASRSETLGRRHTTRIELAATSAGSVDAAFRRIDRGEFHQDVASRLMEVTLSRFPPDLRPGTVFSYSLEQWPVTLKWDAVVSEYHPPHQIRWVKSRGYFPKWDLMLELQEQGNTLATRAVLVYEMPAGFVASIKNRYIVRQIMSRFIESQLAAVGEAAEPG